MNRLGKVQFKPAAGVLGLALLLTSSAALLAQQPDPNMRAARLSYVEGDVQLSQGNQVLADPALVNTPLFEGTEIAAKEDGRAEIQFDDGSVVRISPNSSLKIAVLRQDGGATRAESVLESGLAYFELQGDSSANHTLARFGDCAVAASGFTVLRVSLDNLPGEVAVFAGNAHLERGNTLSLDLHGGESVALNASDPNLYNLAETIEPDSWDGWNSDRDQDLTTQEAAKTAASGSEPNSNNPAWGDLDANGNWYNVPDQGYVWSPNEAASGDWEPYGCGNWVWTPQFGYVWVSCEQWGYLPYTSGYWNFYDDFGWGWTPGYGYPWWTTGGWVGNVGNHPMRYQPPHRPRGGPVHPPNGPIRRGGFYQPNPVIAVNRSPHAPTGNPVHVVGRPVTIGGTTVQPLRPLSPRPVYNPSTASGFNRSNPGYGHPGNGSPRYGVPGNGNSGPAYGRSTYVPWANSPSSPSRSGGWTAPAGGYRAPVPSRGYSGGSAPSRAPSGGGGHVGGGGGAPHVSSGGGGGGHVSAGGGGGGHPSSGGGHH
ncbi:MAG: FecR family protein [Terracidiphilus sp.]